MSDCSSSSSSCGGISNSKNESSRLSALAPPFNLKRTAHGYDVPRDHDSLSSSNPFLLDNYYSLEGAYHYGYGYGYGDRRYDNGPNSFRVRYPFEPEEHLFDGSDVVLMDSSDFGGAASMPSNSYLKQDEQTCSHLSEHNSFQAQEIRVSCANATPLLLKLGSLENVDSCANAAVINEESCSGRLSENVNFCACGVVNNSEIISGLNFSAIGEPHVLPNANDKMVCPKKIRITKSKEKQNCGPVSNKAMDRLVVEKTDLSPNVSDGFNFESHGAESSAAGRNSSVTVDEKDSDVDSPCWKGTGAYQSLFQVNGPLSSEPLKIEREAHKSLNPLAPEFFPGSVKPLIEYHENICEGNDSSSFMEASSMVALSTKQQRLTDTSKAGSWPSGLNTVTENQFSNQIHDGGNECSEPNKSNRSSVLNSSLGDEPCTVEAHLTSGGQAVMGANVLASVDNIRLALPMDSTNVSFATRRNSFTSFYSEEGFPVCSEPLRGALKSISPKIDVQLVIKTMHDMSKLLKWNYSNDFDSINDHERDMIQHIIKNLNVCITNEVGQRVSKSESDQLFTSRCPRKLIDCHKEFQDMRMKTVTVANDRERQESSSAKFRNNVLGCPCPRNIEGIKKGDEVTQVFRKAFKENHQIMEEMHLQPLWNGDL